MLPSVRNAWGTPSMMTIKRRKFAYLVAQGAPLYKAYNEVYGVGTGKPEVRRIEASRMAKDPDVANAIHEYELQLMPAISDLRKLREEMIGTIRYLALHSPEHKIRLSAASKLVDYTARFEESESLKKRTVTIDKIVAEIAQITA